jgi:cytochrome c biogenesis protein
MEEEGRRPRWADNYKTAIAGCRGPTVTEADGVVHLYAEKGVSSRFGAYATHAGIVIIFIGAIIGNVFGFKSYVNIPDGGSVPSGRTGARSIDLPFSVRNNRFWLETYRADSRKIRLGLERHGERSRGLAQDDHSQRSARLQGVWFCSQLWAGRRRDGAGGGQPTGRYLAGLLSLRPNEPVPIDSYGAVRGVNYEQNFQGTVRPQVVIDKPGQPVSSVWIPQGRPDLDHRRNDSLVFSFGGLTAKMYTGLQVAKDPGVNVVWLGCLLLTAGMMGSFFVSHRRIWIRLAEGPQGKVEITAGGTTNRNRPAFEKTFASVLAEVRKDPPNTDKENRA